MFFFVEEIDFLHGHHLQTNSFSGTQTMNHIASQNKKNMEQVIPKRPNIAGNEIGAKSDGI